MKATYFESLACLQAVCNASCNSLLSGIDQSTSGWYGSKSDMRKTYDQVMGKHKMLPQHFKDSGYHTMAVGKKEWQADRLDRRIETWKNNDNIPDWLK